MTISTYVAAVQTDGQTGFRGRFLGHLCRIGDGLSTSALGDVEGSKITKFSSGKFQWMGSRLACRVDSKNFRVVGHVREGKRSV